MFKTLGHIAGFTEGSIRYIINQFKEGYKDGLESSKREIERNSREAERDEHQDVEHLRG